MGSITGDFTVLANTSGEGGVVQANKLIVNQIVLNGQDITFPSSDLLAPAFSSQSTYSRGDAVIYDGLLYVCFNDITTAGDWTGAVNWISATVAKFVNELSEYKRLSVSAITGTASETNSGVKDYYISHTLGTRYVTVTVYDELGQIVVVSVTCTSASQLVVQFDQAPLEGKTYYVVCKK